MEKEQLMEEHIFGNPRIRDSSGKPYKIIKDLARGNIFRLRDLSFKSGRKNYNKKVFISIKEIKKPLPLLSSQLSQENNLPFNKKRISIDRIRQKDIYIKYSLLRSSMTLGKYLKEHQLNLE